VNPKSENRAGIQKASHKKTGPEHGYSGPVYCPDMLVLWFKTRTSDFPSNKVKVPDVFLGEHSDYVPERIEG